jgi:hypothetical protein
LGAHFQRATFRTLVTIVDGVNSDPNNPFVQADTASPSSFAQTGGPPRNWWQRNWKWFVPSGCLAVLGLFAAFVSVIVTAVFGLMKSSDPYREAVAAATANPAVQEALGTPIEAGFFVTGSIQVTDSTGSASLAVPLSGPRGTATIHVEGTKAAGRWTYSTFEVRVDGSGETIALDP